jgi:hypothetical protein
MRRPGAQPLFFASCEPRSHFHLGSEVAAGLNGAVMHHLLVVEEVAKTCGTSTSTRSVSICARRNMGGAVGLSAVMSAPAS